MASSPSWRGVRLPLPQRTTVAHDDRHGPVVAGAGAELAVAGQNRAGTARPSWLWVHRVDEDQLLVLDDACVDDCRALVDDAACRWARRRPRSAVGHIEPAVIQDGRWVGDAHLVESKGVGRCPPGDKRCRCWGWSVAFKVPWKSHPAVLIPAAHSSAGGGISGQHQPPGAVVVVCGCGVGRIGCRFQHCLVPVNLRRFRDQSAAPGLGLSWPCPRSRTPLPQRTPRPGIRATWSLQIGRYSSSSSSRSLGQAAHAHIPGGAPRGGRCWSLRPGVSNRLGARLWRRHRMGVGASPWSALRGSGGRWPAIRHAGRPRWRRPIGWLRPRWGS